jgi:hypothetical protein
MKLTKENVSRMLAKAGVQEAHRDSYMRYDIFIADGRVDNPGWVLRRFGIGKDDFPNGCFCTFWFVAKDEKFEVGQLLPFDPLHDPQYDDKSKRIARTAAALVQARTFIDRLRTATHPGNTLYA